jgi:hypothetical protein
MVALRFTAGVFLLSAVIAFVSEMTRWQLGIAGAPFTPLVQQLSEAAPVTLAAIQRAVQTRIHPLAWDPIMKAVLSPPAWMVLFAIGLLLGYAGRRRPRVDVFTN